MRPDFLALKALQRGVVAANAAYIRHPQDIGTVEEKRIHIGAIRLLGL
jgi:hypothetical protein